MTKALCLYCHGTGWVCERHMDKPWEGPNACECGGAGTNCGCNPEGNHDFDEVIAEIDQ